MTLSDGDLVEFDYELWVDGKDELHDTTLEDAAQAAGIRDENAFYAPVTYVVGSGRLINGLEDALRRAETGKTETIDLEPGDAYGSRDASLVETMPLAEFRKHDIEPRAGQVLTIKNRRAEIVTVGGGRVRVDFNAPLAGKRLRYRFTVRRVAKTDEEKLAGLFRMNFPAPLEWVVKTTKEGDAVRASVRVPEPAVFHQAWPTAKLRTLADAARYTKLQSIEVVEAYPLKPRDAPAAEAASPTQS